MPRRCKKEGVVKLEKENARRPVQSAPVPSQPHPQQPAAMPAPLIFDKPRRQSGCGLWLLVLILLVGIGGTVSWQFLDQQERQQIQNRVYSVLGGTPLEFLRTWIMPRLETKTPLPPINESGDHGVIPPKDVRTGVEVHGVITPQSESTAASEPGMEEQPPQEETPLEPLPEDERVKPAFINDLARWVVGRYQPGRQGGALAVSVQSMNQRYGTSMTGLLTPRGGDPRLSLLRYAFTPSMIRGLYAVYADSFLRALAESARSSNKNLGEEQLANLYQTVGSRCLLLAGGLESVSALPDLSGRLRALEQSEQNEVDCNRRLLDERFDLEQIRDRKGSSAEIAEGQRRVNLAAHALQQAMEQTSGERRKLVEDIRRKGSSALNDEAVLYLARWVGRRLVDNANALESTRTAAQVLRDLAGRCVKAAREGAPADPRLRQTEPPAASQQSIAPAAAKAQTNHELLQSVPRMSPSLQGQEKNGGQNLLPPASSLQENRVTAPPRQPKGPVTPSPQPSGQ